MRVHLVRKVVLALRIGIVEVLLEICEGYFVGVLKFAVILALLLHCIVSEVNHPVSQILQSELLRRGTNVALFIPIALHHIVHGGHENIASNIELAFAV